MSQQFVQWMIQLGGRIQNIESRLHSETVEWLDNETTRCKSLLGDLYDLAKRQSIDIAQHYEKFVNFEGRLRWIERAIGQRKEQAEKSKRPWWLKVIDTVLTAISHVADI